MPTIKDLNDMYADIEVGKNLSKIHSKNLETRQPSLFGVNELNELNRDEMKKRAVEKLEKEEARKAVEEENKAKREADEKKSKLKQRPMVSPEGNIFRGAAAGGGGGGGGIKSMKYEPKTFKAGGKVSSASKRADGCAVRGKTKGRIV
jgi:hypothetical protein